VRLPGPGTLDVIETAWNDNVAGIARLLQPAVHRFAFARATTPVLSAGATRLSVAPNPRGELLDQHHRYRVTLRLWVTYMPLGASARSVGIYGLHLSPATAASH
jgi:hypothetical protein